MDNKIAERLNDKSFVEKLMGFGTTDEVKSFFKNEGLNITDDEINEIGTSLNDVISQFKDISDEELSEVSGGTLHGKLERVFTEAGMKIGSDLDLNTGVKWKGGVSEKIGRNLVEHSGGYATGTMIGAAAIVAYAGYKKGWPAVKALGQKKGWWK